MNTTTMRPKESIQICIEEKAPLFCAGLGNPGFMVEQAADIIATKIPQNVTVA
jgi:hypothetical protein